MLLAYLPFMLYPYGLFKSVIAALWIAIFLWVTVGFFWFSRRFFPDRSLKGAFFLWLIVWAQAVWTLTKLPPYWVASVFFLAPVAFLEATAKPVNVRVFFKKALPSPYLSISDKRKMEPSQRPFGKREIKFERYFLEQLLAGAGFSGFVILIGFIREIGEKRLGMHVFEQPAGILLLITAAAFLWKNQPYRHKG